MKKLTAAVLALALLLASGSALAATGTGSDSIILTLNDTRTASWEWSISSDSVTLTAYGGSAQFVGTFSIELSVFCIDNNYRVSITPDAREGEFDDDGYINGSPTRIGTWNINNPRGGDPYASASRMQLDEGNTRVIYEARADLLPEYQHIILPVSVSIPITFRCEYRP